MKHAGAINIEFRQSIEGIESEVTALFRETHAHRKSDYGAFDDVPQAYFREVLHNGNGSARVMLCRIGSRSSASIST